MALVALLALPFMFLILAAVRGAVLFFPTMILLGVVHSFLPWVPALGWWQTLAVVTLLSLLIPTGVVSND